MNHLSETIFELPGGLVLENGRRLNQAKLRPLNGYEEEWLASHPSTPSARVVSWLLNDCLMGLDDEPPDREQVPRLLVGDRDYLMLQLRRMTLGEHFHAVLSCPACSANMDVDFEASDVPIEWRPQSASTYTLDLDSQAGSGRTVRFRLPTGGDQEAVLGLDAESAVNALITRCLIDDSGTSLTPGERTAVSEAMEQLAPQIDLELELQCPECTHTFVEPFDITLFFFKEMRMKADQLLREIHCLAFYYHWSEAEILSLTMECRRKYLALLSETLRQD
jgi:hypothetical protein